MDYLLEIEIRDGKPVLSMSDLAALLCGRLLMAWGELDFRIEALLEWTWGAVANRQRLEGKKHDPMPAEGRSNHRLKLLRKYFLAICNGEEKPMAKFDKLVGQQKRLEEIRSVIAHGVTLHQEKDGGYVINPWTFTKIESGKRSRDAIIQEFTFDQLCQACLDISAVREAFEALVEFYTKPFIYNSVAMAAAKSLPPHDTPMSA